MYVLKGAARSLLPRGHLFDGLLRGRFRSALPDERREGEGKVECAGIVRALGDRDYDGPGDLD